jgi:hypothetical protein
MECGFDSHHRYQKGKMTRKQIIALVKDYFYWKDIVKRWPSHGFAPKLKEVEKALKKVIDVQ